MIAYTIRSLLWGAHLGVRYVTNGERYRKKEDDIEFFSTVNILLLTIQHEQFPDVLSRKMDAAVTQIPRSGSSKTNQKMKPMTDCCPPIPKKQPLGWWRGLRLFLCSFPNKLHSINCLYGFITTSHWRLLFTVRKISSDEKNEEQLKTGP